MKGLFSILPLVVYDPHKQITCRCPVLPLLHAETIKVKTK